MSEHQSAGKKFREALAAEQPLQIIGTINAYCALMAKQTGYRCIYLSGAGVANASYGIPDVGNTTLNDVLIDAKRITSICDLPLMVDIDTAWDDQEGVARTIRECEKAGIAAVHLEDQIPKKRCGHLQGKQLVSQDEMVARVSEAVGARQDSDFFIMARTDAAAVEGLDAAIARAQAYVEAGADGIFAEALTSAEDYQRFCDALSVPVLANMTEFGQSPLLSLNELKQLGVSMVLYPLSAFRAMNAAALQVYQAIRETGSQKTLLELMQDRAALYKFLGYQP